jgi:hypothetical protein
VAARAARVMRAMADTQRPALSSVFEDMLAQNKRQFDDLYRSPRSGTAAPSHAGWDRAKVPASAAPPSARLDPDSPAARRLNERFGDNWRYEIAEQQRAGEEAIVLCKLIFGKQGAVRTQFGRARLAHGPVAGASGQVRFRLGAAGADRDERDAFRRATEAALMNCIDLT